MLGFWIVDFSRTLEKAKPPQSNYTKLILLSWCTRAHIHRGRHTPSAKLHPYQSHSTHGPKPCRRDTFAIVYVVAQCVL